MVVERRNGVDRRGRPPIPCIDVCPVMEFTPAVEKILLLDAAASLANRYHDTHVVGVTTGAWDLIHRGHIRYIEALVMSTFARAQLEGKPPLVLIGVNSDQSVRRNKQDKSQNRPAQPEIERAECIASLRGVDRVFVFDDNMDLVYLRPHLFQASTGSDHPPETREELKVLTEQHGTLLIARQPFSKEGDTDLLKKIHEMNIY